MATRRIRDFLAGNRVTFRSINHQCAYTAQEVAEHSHVPGRCMAKSVIAVIDGRLAIVAVPANSRIDLSKLRDETFDLSARIAEESEFVDHFDGCQVGTVPPFGNLFGVETFVDRRLSQEDYIAFNAGTHTDVYIVRYCDYARIAQPQVIDVATAPKSEKPEARGFRERQRQEREEETIQVQCGCAVLHHAGAD